MAVFKNILIYLATFILTGLLISGSFVFGESTAKAVRTTGKYIIKKNVVSVATDAKGGESIIYSNYQSGSVGSGFLAVDFGRLSTAFVMQSTDPTISFSGGNNIIFERIQGIVSLYDPFSLYTLAPKDGSYKINQITNGSFYISDEPDGTISIYSIDVVAELSFFDKGEKMTDMILFPGMYIRFNPEDNDQLRSADLFRIMLVLGDSKSDKNTGLEFVNPRVTNGSDDIFFMFKLPIQTRPLFQMLHILFVDRIAQVDLIKNYSSTRNYVSDDVNKYILNPSKKNHYLLDDLKAVLSRAVQSQMESNEFRLKIEGIVNQSKLLVKGNSVNTMLESFLTDTRFAIFGKNQNTKFNAIYIETASILGITPSTGKGKFFQYLSDIYSRNIALQRRDPTFSGIDTYTPTADGLKQTLSNDNIESKDYFDVALYAYQLLQKAKDGQVFTDESLLSKATYDLVDTIFDATEKYIQGLPQVDQKVAYQTLVIQFYAPIANTMSRSLYGSFSAHTGDKIYLDRKYLDGDTIKFDTKLRDTIERSFVIMRNIYDKIAPLYAEGEQNYALLSFRDSVLRIGGFLDMTTDGQYREYQQVPYIGTDISGVFMPNITTEGALQINSSGTSNTSSTTSDPMMVLPLIPDNMLTPQSSMIPIVSIPIDETSVVPVTTSGIEEVAPSIDNSEIAPEVDYSEPIDYSQL
ncbi:hypothetical protein K2X92_01140 [Candidatus Gracilibacteria bacterium]|nr:hypothetical protein [Candidatus Gracilibacteria bacterium]